MKTPEEIKKGLECCSVEAMHCGPEDPKCAYDCGSEECIRNLMHDALAYIKQLEAQVTKWISVEERLPERIVTGCLVYADGWTQVADWTHDKCGNDWWFYVDGEYDPEITHWMPLPEPPKEEEK